MCIGVLLALAGCNNGIKKDPSQVPPPPTAATLPPVPPGVPPEQQEAARQQMMSSMQAGRNSAMHVNGQVK